MRKCFDTRENITSGCWMGSRQRPSSRVLAPAILPADSRFILPAAAACIDWVAVTRRLLGSRSAHRCSRSAGTPLLFGLEARSLAPLAVLSSSLGCFPSLVIAALCGRIPQRPSVHLSYFCDFPTFWQRRCRSSLRIINVCTQNHKSTHCATSVFIFKVMYY